MHSLGMEANKGIKIMQYYPKVEKFVKKAFSESKEEYGGDVKHLEVTAKLVKKLKPDADEALLIAAISHDIERAFRDEELMKKVGWGTPEYYRIHMEKGAQIIGDFLKSLGAPSELIDKVVSLISRHELGGNEDEDLLKDADSLSFFVFQEKMDWYLNVRAKQIGKENAKKKLDWMYGRITTKKAKEIARPLYEQVIKQLEN